MRAKRLKSVEERCTTVQVRGADDEHDGNREGSNFYARICREDQLEGVDRQSTVNETESTVRLMMCNLRAR
jgi:hypothetical protein